MMTMEIVKTPFTRKPPEDVPLEDVARAIITLKRAGIDVTEVEDQAGRFLWQNCVERAEGPVMIRFFSSNVITIEGGGFFDQVTSRADVIIETSAGSKLKLTPVRRGEWDVEISREGHEEITVTVDPDDPEFRMILLAGDVEWIRVAP